jgi:hypothetical protein
MIIKPERGINLFFIHPVTLRKETLAFNRGSSTLSEACGFLDLELFSSDYII